MLTRRQVDLTAEEKEQNEVIAALTLKYSCNDRGVPALLASFLARKESTFT